MNHILPSAALALACSLTNSARGGVPPAYAITDLGQVTITSGGAKDINEAGQIALNLGGTAYIWDRGILFPPGGLVNNNTTFAINAAGHLTWTASGRAQFWDGVMQTELPALGRPTDLTAGFDLNIHNQIVGSSYVADLNRTRAFVWDESSITDLGSLTPGQQASAMGINDHGIIVGFSDDAPVPVSWVHGIIQALQLPPGTTRGQAFNINQAGQIVGYASDGSGSVPTPTLWNVDGSVVSLGRLPGDTFGLAYGINNLTEVVGFSSQSGGNNPHAFLFADGGMHDLTELTDDPNWVLEVAYAVNDSGLIVGKGRLNNVAHAFLLTPIPEPSVATIFLASVSLICLRVLRQRMSTGGTRK